jgi:hypothetical protein
MALNKMKLFLTLLLFPSHISSFVIPSSSTIIKLNSFSSDWGDFRAIDDVNDDIEDNRRIDQTSYATEDDTIELKAQIGSTKPAPTIEFDAEPIFVPQGKYSLALML